jgi:hypothetical protein
MKKYTDEQLSRILGEHDTGMLTPCGYNWGSCGYRFGCINQAAYNIPTPWEAFKTNQEPADRFDKDYDSCMSHEELLRLLQGLQ